MAAGDKTVKDLGYLSKNQGMAAAMPRHTGSSATGADEHREERDICRSLSDLQHFESQAVYSLVSYFL